MHFVVAVFDVLWLRLCVVDYLGLFGRRRSAFGCAALALFDMQRLGVLLPERLRLVQQYLAGCRFEQITTQQKAA